jgi:hypothetical protein
MKFEFNRIGNGENYITRNLVAYHIFMALLGELNEERR